MDGWIVGSSRAAQPSVESFRTVARRTQSTPSPGRQSGVDSWMKCLLEAHAKDLEAFWPSNFGPKMKLTRQNAALVAGIPKAPEGGSLARGALQQLGRPRAEHLGATGAVASK